MFYLATLLFYAVYDAQNQNTDQNAPGVNGKDGIGKNIQDNQIHDQDTGDAKLNADNNNDIDTFDGREPMKPEVYILRRNYTLFPTTPLPEGFGSAHYMPITIAIIVGAVGLVISILATSFFIRPLIITHTHSDTINYQELEMYDF